ncbi:MAG: Flagellar hook-length control protein FliK [Polyangiaceae bacterium]|jgi:hypothetical protein|nr:Flagellar hook-length control protein FliK [Polyangiaceae bacterium]
MAKNRGSQRGVVKVASSLLLAGVGALLSVAGCAVDGETGAGPSGGPETVGTSTQAQLICSVKGGCPPKSECGEWLCSGTTCKLVTAGAADGSRCAVADVGRGICAGNACCTSGCLEKTKAGLVCHRGTSAAACGTALAECADCTVSDACSVGVCVPDKFVCDTVAAPANTPCSDGNKCNGQEVCSGTSCKAGGELDCDDDEECTTDACDAATGCTHVARTGASCNDGDGCTTGDKCGSDGLCKAGTPINCNDGEVCTADKCEAGKCVNTATTVACSDGDPCTTADKCVAGKCQGTSANGVDCNDDKPCTVDKQVACNSTECSHTPASAQTACPAEDKCHQNGLCSGTDDTCVQGPAINCDDSNPCTTDDCDPATGCTHVNNPSADCSDGDACTENDVCVAGVCGGKPKKCLALDACHEGGTCDPDSGTCDDPRSQDGKECPGGACESGKCVLDPNANVGGQGAGGDSSAVGGAASGGEGNAAAGDDGTSGSGGTNSAGTSSNGEGGEAVDPTRVFQREPGGCSCNVPSSTPSGLSWLAGFSLVALLAARRRDRGRGETTSA